MHTLSRDLVTSVQRRLAELQFYKLRVDGIPGVGTESAIIRFKEQHGLRARSHVGPVTLGTLFGPDAQSLVIQTTPGEPPWLTYARSFIGLREVRGSSHNPTIMKWAMDLDIWYPGDETPWCGLFVAQCMTHGAPLEAQDFNRLGARAWLEYGVAAPTSPPPLGGVGVLWRTHPTKSWHGHVFIITGYSSNAIRGIGGNQSNSVSETWFSRDRLLGVRAPADVALTSAPIAEVGMLSVNEA